MNFIHFLQKFPLGMVCSLILCCRCVFVKMGGDGGREGGGEGERGFYFPFVNS